MKLIEKERQLTKQTYELKKMYNSNEINYKKAQELMVKQNELWQLLQFYRNYITARDNIKEKTTKKDKKYRRN